MAQTKLTLETLEKLRNDFQALLEEYNYERHASNHWEFNIKVYGVHIKDPQLEEALEDLQSQSYFDELWISWTDTYIENWMSQVLPEYECLGPTWGLEGRMSGWLCVSDGGLVQTIENSFDDIEILLEDGEKLEAQQEFNTLKNKYYKPLEKELSQFAEAVKRGKAAYSKEMEHNLKDYLNNNR